MIESSAENAEVYSVKPALAQVWIGLYRVPWTWSDNSEYSFKNWLPLQPDNFLFNQFCVVENALHQWNDEPCALEFPFICQKGDSSVTQRKLLGFQILQYLSLMFVSAFLLYFSVSQSKKMVVRIRTVTDADMTDPAINARILQQVKLSFPRFVFVHLWQMTEDEWQEAAESTTKNISFILPQLGAELASQGLTNFTLQWKTLPIKQKENWEKALDVDLYYCI